MRNSNHFSAAAARTNMT